MQIFCILGATASGKTALSLELADYIQHKYKKVVEIISLDSALVYKDMNIGTAKPSLIDRNGIFHHLIDIIQPINTYNVGNFLADVKTITTKAESQNKIILLVGGTMLYYHALCHGLHDIPSQDLAIRQKINDEALTQGWHALHQKLYSLDPISADKIKSNDSQRIQRALEIYYISGKIPSEFYAQDKKIYANNYVLNTIALMPSREILHQRINQRFIKMLEQGFIAEVEDLLVKYPTLNENSPAMRCVGYRQIYEYLNNKINSKELIEKGQAATRQLAKRQITWLKKTHCTHINPLNLNAFNLLQQEFDKSR